MKHRMNCVVGLLLLVLGCRTESPDLDFGADGEHASTGEEPAEEVGSESEAEPELEGDDSGSEQCGNAITEGGEECDGEDLGGMTCSGLGFEGGRLGCTAGCDFDTHECSTCGNGQIDPGEGCDLDGLGGIQFEETCISLGYSGGVLGCTTSCVVDESTCSTCGNGIREGDEVCDGEDVGDAMCAHNGDGSVPCSPDCQSLNPQICVW